MAQAHSFSKKTFNALLAFMSLFLSASVLSLNAFVVPAESLNNALTSVWSTGLGFVSFVYAIWNFVSVGILSVPRENEGNETIGILSRGARPQINPLTQRVRFASVPTAAVYLLLMLSVPALKSSSSTMLYAAVMVQGVPYSFFFLLGVEVLTAWFPDSPSVSMTLVSASYGLSQFILSPLFNFSIIYFGVVNSIIVTSIFLFCSILLVVFLIEFPSEDTLPASRIVGMSDKESKTDDNIMKTEDATITHNIDVKSTVKYHSDQSFIHSELCSHGDQGSYVQFNYSKAGDSLQGDATHFSTETFGKPQDYPRTTIEIVDDSNTMPWYEILQCRKFHKYLIIVFMGRAAVALIPFYFKLGHVFGIATKNVVFGFQILSLVSIAWALGVNSLYEFLNTRLRRQSISKPFLIAVFMLQTTLFIILVPLSNTGKATCSLIVISFLIVILESQTALSVILAGDLFGVKNCVAAYGLAGGLSIGPAETIFTYSMSFVEQKFSMGGVATPASFSPFYFICTAALLVGAFVVITMG